MMIDFLRKLKSKILSKLRGAQSAPGNQEAVTDPRPGIVEKFGEAVNVDEYGGLYISDESVLTAIENMKLAPANDYWAEQTNWSLQSVFPERYANQIAFVNDAFIPYLDKQQYLCDLASANGEWSFFVSPYVDHIDGFEYSDFMVKTASEEAAKQQIQNVSFAQADAVTVTFPRVYDNFMMMGLLTCLKDDAADVVVCKVYDAIKPGGRLITKDSVLFSNYKKDLYYFYSIDTNYQAVYRSKQSYFERYVRAGFVLENERVLHEINRCGMVVGSIGAVWRKV